jgi:prolyl-tRNA synthetase
MGCYGIGVSRVMGTVAELWSDDKGLVWPDNISPAKVYLARLGNISSVVSAADELYKRLTEAGIEVIYDDRDMRAGEKFADADLLGIPFRLVVSEKTVEKGQHELKSRTETESKDLSSDQIFKALAG